MVACELGGYDGYEGCRWHTAIAAKPLSIPADKTAPLLGRTAPSHGLLQAPSRLSRFSG